MCLCGGADEGADAVLELGTGPTSLSGFSLECALLAGCQDKLAPSTALKAWIWKLPHAGGRV